MSFVETPVAGDDGGVLFITYTDELIEVRLLLFCKGLQTQIVQNE